MSEIWKALILGILQGLAEFLPVSSSGHIELGKVLLGLEVGLDFSILVHIGTALSTVVVFRKDILHLITGFFTKEDIESRKQVGLLLASAVPVGIIGVAFKDQISTMFEGNLTLVGFALIFTSGILFLTTRVPRSDKDINLGRALIMGLAQTVAIIPGISRSGATISTALLLKIDPIKAARFSFLMVLIPIFGEALLDLLDFVKGESAWAVAPGVAIAGFSAAFLAGLLACTAMIRIVRTGKLHWFSIYCLVVGIAAIWFGLSAHV